MSRSARLLLFACLGPITGPLAAGLERSIRQRRHAMAGIYGLAIVEAWILMGAVAVQLAAMLGIHIN